MKTVFSPDRNWKEISMVFLFDLLKTDNESSAILVAVDKPPKQAHFTPVKSSAVTAKHVTDLFYRKVFQYHEFPRKVISDRDSRFNSRVWTELIKLFQILLNTSTASLPRPHGQSKWAFRTVEEVPKCFVDWAQGDWDHHLPGLEFA